MISHKVFIKNKNLNKLTARKLKTRKLVKLITGSDAKADAQKVVRPLILKNVFLGNTEKDDPTLIPC